MPPVLALYPFRRGKILQNPSGFPIAGKSQEMNRIRKTRFISFILLFYPLSAGLSTLRPNLIEAGFDAGDLIVVGRQRGELRAERLGNNRARVAELFQAVHHAGNVDHAGFAR